MILLQVRPTKFVVRQRPTYLSRREHRVLRRYRRCINKRFRSLLSDVVFLFFYAPIHSSLVLVHLPQLVVHAVSIIVLWRFPCFFLHLSPCAAVLIF